MDAMLEGTGFTPCLDISDCPDIARWDIDPFALNRDVMEKMVAGMVSHFPLPAPSPCAPPPNPLFPLNILLLTPSPSQPAPGAYSSSISFFSRGGRQR